MQLFCDEHLREVKVPVGRRGMYWKTEMKCPDDKCYYGCTTRRYWLNNWGRKETVIQNTVVLGIFIAIVAVILYLFYNVKI